ncbi:MAG: LemA family protein [Deltaproteobacteria bacterium]|nr:MAG: LemA family protein [Deltaproteobacteria bacterium]
MQPNHRLLPWAAIVALMLGGPEGCGYNDVIDADEGCKAAWAEVENQYKRRADLVPSLVETVKGAAKFETDTLLKVVEARSNVAGIKLDKDLIDSPERLKQFEEAQGKLSGALSRLMVVVEKYPDLKASASFQALQAQLEGTENRITVARRRFILAVQDYNQVVLHFPSMLGAKLRGKEVRATFQGPAGAENPPEVKF